MDTGKKAEPEINPNPKQAIRVKSKYERLPQYIDINKYQHQVIARYESRKKSCSVIKALSGSIEWPEINVPVKGSFENGYLVMRDHVITDKCDWKLTGVEYQVKDSQKIVLKITENMHELNSKKTQWFCKFDGYLYGSCAGSVANKSRPDFSEYGFDNTDDTTVEISMETIK